jgi:hypothetical protein
MNADCLCKCSGILKFKKVEFAPQWFDFHYVCKKCGQTVIHSKVPTPYGYVVVHVHNLGKVTI